ncbi:MAG TPA: 50S ribosomal protein L15 [bacterium]|nr:50S ribosomal protein L15 [bacterium]
MELHELKFTPGAKKSRKRKGRGPGSGWGKTAGRGEKGQKSRSGASIRPGFEGGQMPLARRLPKVGFTSPSPVRYGIVNLSTLNGFEDGTEVTPELLLEKRIVRKLYDGIKVLGRGSMERKLEVWAHCFSARAREAIEAAGGTCQVIGSRRK